MAKTRRQLYIWQKLWTLGLVFLLFFAVPTGFYVKEVLRTLERSRAELLGVGEARAASEVARALAVHRLYAAATLSGAPGLAEQRSRAQAAVDAAIAALDATLGPELRAVEAIASLKQGWSGLADAVGKAGHRVEIRTHAAEPPEYHDLTDRIGLRTASLCAREALFPQLPERTPP